MGETAVHDIEMFRSVLMGYCGDLNLDDMPWDSGAVLVGSACLASLVLPRGILESKHLMSEIQYVTDKRKLLKGGRLQRWLTGILGSASGAVRTAQLIIDFAGIKQDCLKKLDAVCQFGTSTMSKAGGYGRGDIDFYFVASTKEQGGTAVQKASLAVEASLGPCTVIKTSNSVTLCPSWPHRHVQLITRLQETVDEILSFVDLDCTAVCYDGTHVWVAPRTLRALGLQYNLVPRRMLFNRPDTPDRIAKYAQRGFWVSHI